MKKQLKLNKLYKKIIFLIVLGYLVYIFIGQQKLLNSYKTAQKYYSEELSKQLAYQESLSHSKDNVNSKEYIEKVARDKLDMYLPNERVYIDKGN